MTQSQQYISLMGDNGLASDLKVSLVGVSGVEPSTVGVNIIRDGIAVGSIPLSWLLRTSYSKALQMEINKALTNRGESDGTET